MFCGLWRDWYYLSASGPGVTMSVYQQAEAASLCGVFYSKHSGTDGGGVRCVWFNIMGRM